MITKVGGPPARPERPQIGTRDNRRAEERGLPTETLFLTDPSLPEVGPGYPPTPRDLQRPVLMVHGFNGSSLEWFGLKNYLTTNPHNHFGAVFEAGKEAEFREAIHKDPEAKVFSISFSKPYLSYREVTQEFTRAVEILNEETGSEVDVVTHSMGGLVARNHLDGGHDGIHKLIQIAPPNHGALEADLSLASDKLGIYHHYSDEAKGAVLDLTQDVMFLGAPNNPYLHGLNERWDQQAAKVEPTIVAGLGIPTPHLGWSLLSDGDGMVTARSAYLPGAEFAVADVDQQGDRLFSFKYNHKSVMEHPRILQFVGQVLNRPDNAPPTLTQEG